MRRQTAGLPGLEPACTLSECADRLGVTTERVRQIEAKALKTARRILEARGVRPEHFIEIFRQPTRTD